MFEKARSLVLKDREAARKALADEIAEEELRSIDHELDEIENSEREMQEKREAEAREIAARAAASRELRDVRCAQHEMASQFDNAIQMAGNSFLELESLAKRAAELEKLSGEGVGATPHRFGHARTGAVTAAIWFAARDLAKRLGLRTVAGSRSNIRPLAQLYPKLREK